MPNLSEAGLTRRERQIMDVIWQHGQGTAADILEALPDPPSYSAVRALLRILEHKGHLCHEQRGARYVYLPLASQEGVRRTALQRLVNTFFQGSVAQAAQTLLDLSGRELSDEELDRLSVLIEDCRKEGH